MLEQTQGNRNAVDDGHGLLDSQLPPLGTRSSSAQLKVDSEAQEEQRIKQQAWYNKSTVQQENLDPVNSTLEQSSVLSANRVTRVGNDRNKAGSSHNNLGNEDLHKYAASGSLKDFKASFEKNKMDNPENYLEIVSKYNSNHETALSLAIENEKFDIAIWLLKELTSAQRDHQLDRLVSVNSDKLDIFLNHTKIKGENNITKLLSHTASELKHNRHGGDFQSKLLMLFAYEGHNDDVQFRLGTEVHEADKFDDLVFRYRNDGSNDYKYRFLQAKHSQHLKENSRIKIDGLLGSDKDFDLRKYFISYLKDKEKFNDGSIEDVIICTNKSFAFDVKNFELKKIGEQERKNKYKIFSDLGGQLYQFDSNIDCEKFIKKLKDRTIQDIQDLKVGKKVNDKKVKQTEEILGQLEQHSHYIGEFLSKLVFAAEQPSSIFLSKKIRERMGSNTYNFIYFATFKEYIDEWFASRQSDNTARFILSSEIKDFFNGLENKIANIELIGLGSLFKKKIENFTKLELAFHSASEDVENITNFINSNDDRILKLTYKDKDSSLSIAKVHQILKQEYHDILQFTISDLYSLSSLNSDGLNQGRVVNAFNSENKRLLVIDLDCNFIDEDGEQMLHKLSEALKNISVSNKKVILVLNEELKNQLNEILPNLESVLMENSLNSFSSESKSTIVDIEIVIFGETRKLSSLTTDASKNDLYSAIDGDAIITLINGDSNSIGRKHDYEFDTYIEIPRTLTYQTKINKKCLKANNNELFALIGIERQELVRLIPEEDKQNEERPIPQIRGFIDQDPNKDKPIRFIILDNRRDLKKDFDQLCCDYKEHTIHLLEYKDSELEWKQSQGSLFNLRRFVLKTDSQTKHIQDLTDSAIITAEAGIGKSTLLTTYSISKDSLWPIRINLKDYQKDIDDAKLDAINGVLKFFCNVIDPAGSKTSLINNLLHYCLKQCEVTLLLDGYDEIQRHTREKVVQLCRTLKTTRGKVLVTTRSYTQSELEDALGIFACSLNPFDEEEQKYFLKKFWIIKLNQDNPTQVEKIDEFTKQLLNYFYKLNLMKKEGLVGIALQARMIAEIFLAECKKYIKLEKFNSYNFGISNIYDLYEKFIEYQYKRYFGDKIEISEKLREDSQTALTRSYTKAHGYLALKLLFSDDQIKGLLSQQRFSVQGLQVIGLVKSSKNSCTADFLHPTYAEYFAAEILTHALRKKDDHSKYKAVCKFLLMQIFRGRNQVIRNFIKSKIEKAKDTDLSSKWKKIQDCDLWKEVITIVNLQLSTPDDASCEKSLSELQKEVEKCMNWYNGFYYYNGDDDTKLIQKTFQKFLRETDIEVLKPTLEFLLKANGKSRYNKADYMLKNNISTAVSHYLTQVIKLNTLSVDDIENRDDLIKVIIGEKVFSELTKLLGNITVDGSGILIHKKIRCIDELIELNNLFYILDTFYSTTSQHVKSYISSNENTQKEFITRIINSLKDMPCGNGGIINRRLEHTWVPKSSFIDILYHPNIIAYTKSSINEIYKDKGLVWLERQGVLISRVLEILTPEMSERFNSVLDCKIDGGTHIYTEGVFVDLINYIVNRFRVDKLPQVDRLAFLEMLVRFVGFSVIQGGKLPFTSDQLITTLKLITDMYDMIFVYTLNKQSELVVSKSIEYLSILSTAGLKLIHAENELLVIDPAGEFEYTLSSDYINQVIEVIKFKNTKPSEFQEKFLKECDKGQKVRKRRGSESDLQELKRLKNEN